MAERPATTPTGLNGWLPDAWSVGEESFVVGVDMDRTNKATGKRSHGRKNRLYHVKSGMIVREEFFCYA